MSLEVGDLVQINELPEGLDRETRQVFERCLGHLFRIAGFDRGLVQLEIGEAFSEPEYLRSIWIEPEFVSKRIDQA